VIVIQLALGLGLVVPQRTTINTKQRIPPEVLRTITSEKKYYVVSSIAQALQILSITGFFIRMGFSFLGLLLAEGAGDVIISIILLRRPDNNDDHQTINFSFVFPNVPL